MQLACLMEERLANRMVLELIKIFDISAAQDDLFLVNDIIWRSMILSFMILGMYIQDTLLRKCVYTGLQVVATNRTHWYVSHTMPGICIATMLDFARDDIFVIVSDADELVQPLVALESLLPQG